MKDAITKAIQAMAAKVETTAGAEAMQTSQAILNLTHALQVLKQVG